MGFISLKLVNIGQQLLMQLDKNDGLNDVLRGLRSQRIDANCQYDDLYN